VNELFGIPVGTLLVVLLVGLAAAGAVLAILVARNPVLARLGVRNVGRRGSRTALIVASGLHADQKISAVCRARALPLCQITAGFTPRAAADAARSATMARPACDNGRTGST